jgi:predicted MFS family arabinose efflux permease
MSAHSSRPPGLSLVGLLAVSAGATVANLYYSQPILETIARQFGVSTSAASLIVTLTQLGYALSLLLVVPLGDIFERRRLIVMTSAVSALMLVAVALSPGFRCMLLTSFLLNEAATRRRRGMIDRLRFEECIRCFLYRASLRHSLTAGQHTG